MDLRGFGIGGLDFLFVFGVGGEGGDGFEGGFFGLAFGFGFGFAFALAFGLGVGGLFFDIGNDVTKLIECILMHMGIFPPLLTNPNITNPNITLFLPNPHRSGSNLTNTKQELIINLTILASLSLIIKQVH